MQGTIWNSEYETENSEYEEERKRIQRNEEYEKVIE